MEKQMIMDTRVCEAKIKRTHVEYAVREQLCFKCFDKHVERPQLVGIDVEAVGIVLDRLHHPLVERPVLLQGALTADYFIKCYQRRQQIPQV